MKQDITIGGMHCKSCEMLVTEAIEDTGAKPLKVTQGQATVEYNESRTSLEKIKDAIRAEGYQVE